MIFQQNPTKRVYWAWSAFSSAPPSLVVVLGISRSIKALTFSKDPSLISTGASACRNEERSVCFTMSLFKCSLFLFTCQKQVLLVYIPPSFWMTVALKPHVLLHAIHVPEWSPNTPRCRRRDFFWHQVVCQREICLHAEYPSSCFLIFPYWSIYLLFVIEVHGKHDGIHCSGTLWRVPTLSLWGCLWSRTAR